MTFSSTVISLKAGYSEGAGHAKPSYGMGLPAIEQRLVPIAVIKPHTWPSLGQVNSCYAIENVLVVLPAPVWSNQGHNLAQAGGQERSLRARKPPKLPERSSHHKNWLAVHFLLPLLAQ